MDFHSMADLEHLMRKAEEFIDKNNIPMATISKFYRNKKPIYFEHIENDKGNIMECYMKDNSGDPKNPINRQLKGLFFAGNTQGGGLPGMSPFGSRRLIIPVSRLFNSSKNLYFCDFYCVMSTHAKHYVTLVVTTPGTEADRFCSRKLIKLDKGINRFLTVNMAGSVKICNNIAELWIEVMVTDDINITEELKHGANFTDTQIFGKGSSDAIGMRKNPYCPKCNLKVTHKFVHFFDNSDDSADDYNSDDSSDDY